MWKLNAKALQDYQINYVCERKEILNLIYSCVFHFSIDFKNSGNNKILYENLRNKLRKQYL